MSLIKLSLGGKKLNHSRPGRVSSVTSRLGTGKRLTLFYSVVIPAFLLFLAFRSLQLSFHSGYPQAVTSDKINFKKGNFTEEFVAHCLFFKKSPINFCCSERNWKYIEEQTRRKLNLKANNPGSSLPKNNAQRLPTSLSGGHKELSSNSAIVNEPKCGGRGEVAGSQPRSKQL
jgi:hypothetical protein